jgi:hypothetical protein
VLLMPTGKADLSVYQGDDCAWVVLVTLEDGTTPAEITDYTAQAQIRRNVAQDDPVIVDTFSAVVQSPDVLLALTHDQTKLLCGRYVWDLQLTSPAGAITTILRGNVNVTAEVTATGAPLAAVLAEAAAS